MNNRVTSDSENSVNLFPFLAVLLCTMGALLVLLVVLAQRAGQRAVAEAKQATVALANFQQELSEDSEEAAELVRKLDGAREYQKELSNIRKQADQRLEEEKLRLSHLEDHTRRLEDELLQLSLTAEQLEATENNQAVDQYQAERELERMQQLVIDNEAKLDELREQAKGKKTYAIVPFEGKDGTTDPRIFIECCREGIILQPEGIRFVSRDFSDKKSASSPLVAAIRATQEHLRTKALEAGEPNPPTAIPLLLVRSDGDVAFRKALSSFEASGEHFGVDYLSAEGELSFPISADPILATKQQRAVLDARVQLEKDIKDQPSRFQNERVRVVSLNSDTIKQLRASQSEGQRGKGHRGKGSGSNRHASSEQALSEWIQRGEHGKQVRGNPSGATEGLELGALSGDGNSDGLELDFAGGAGSSGGQTNTTGLDETNGAPSGANSEGSASMNQNQGAGSEGAEATGSASGQGSTISDKPSSGKPGPANWALDRSRSQSSIPLQRPVQVEVSKDQFALLPSRDSTVTRREISMLQPANAIAREFSKGLQERADEWGLAGADLHWKPVLYLHVGPDATDTAIRLVELLSNSGLEVRMSEKKRFSQRGMKNATR